MVYASDRPTTSCNNWHGICRLIYWIELDRLTPCPRTFICVHPLRPFRSRIPRRITRGPNRWSLQRDSVWSNLFSPHLSFFSDNFISIFRAFSRILSNISKLIFYSERYVHLTTDMHGNIYKNCYEMFVTVMSRTRFEDR